MSTIKKKKIVYVTSSDFKNEENKIFMNRVKMDDGVPVSDLFEFEIRSVPIMEILEVDLRVMVQEEVTKAYSHLKVPCIVEHAGIIFKDYMEDSYPGGLTKPMWKALGDRFMEETNSKGRDVIAKAIVAYCDGMKVHTFVGETTGKLADCARGSRKFYWDTVFVPDDPTGKAKDMTYAEIVDAPDLGLEYKIEILSQSTRAMMEFLKFFRNEKTNDLWPVS